MDELLPNATPTNEWNVGGVVPAHTTATPDWTWTPGPATWTEPATAPGGAGGLHVDPAREGRVYIGEGYPTERIHRCTRDSHHWECKHEEVCECGRAKRTVDVNVPRGL